MWPSGLFYFAFCHWSDTADWQAEDSHEDSSFTSHHHPISYNWVFQEGFDQKKVFDRPSLSVVPWTSSHWIQCVPKAPLILPYWPSETARTELVPVGWLTCTHNWQSLKSKIQARLHQKVWCNISTEVDFSVHIPFGLTFLWQSVKTVINCTRSLLFLFSLGHPRPWNVFMKDRMTLFLI